MSDAVGSLRFRNRLWLAYLLLGTGGTIVYLLFPSAILKTAVIVPASATAAAAIVAGIRLHRPARPLGWYILAGGQLAAALNWVIWQAHILATGEILAPGSVADWFLFGSFGLLLASLLMKLSAREVGLAAMVDVTAIASAASMVAWVFLFSGYAHSGTLPTDQLAVHIGFALMDVLVFAVAIRIVVSPGRRPGAFWLLLLGVGGLMTGNIAWNWFTLGGFYSPGTWTDGGWILFSVLAGAAGLHPSMSAVFEVRRARTSQLSRPYIGALAAAILAGPVVLLLDTPPLSSTPAHGLAIVAGGMIIGVAVVVRMAGLLGQSNRLSDELRAQNERLRELDRMKDDFVASVSHELRTPLTSIRGYLELVLDREAGDLTHEQERFLEVVSRNADRLLHLVGDLLFVAQIDAGKIALEASHVRIDDLAEEAIEAARPAAVDKDIELALDTDSVGELMGDRARLAQVLDNLVSNAVKFTPSGGRVSMRAYREHDRAVIEVADTGLGVSAEDQERLFERFFRSEVAAEQAIPGTGLGLAIVKAIVDAHGGEISVTSEVGVGSTFRVAVPLDRTEVAA